MVFRRDSKVDAFQRQISALRHQLGGEQDRFSNQDHDRLPMLRGENEYRHDFPDLDVIGREMADRSPGFIEHGDRDDSPMVMPAIPAADMQTSVVAHSTTWNGNLESSGSLHVHGRVEGSLNAREDVFVGEEATVDAVINAASVTIAGNVRGSIHAVDRFEVLPRGRVVGDIHSPVIVIHDGALVAGDIIMSATHDGRQSSLLPTPTRAVRGGD